MINVNIKVRYLPKRNVNSEQIIDMLKECIGFILGISPRTKITDMMLISDDDRIYVPLDKNDVSIMVKSSNDIYNIVITVNIDIPAKIVYKLFQLFDTTGLFHNFEVIPDDTVVYNDNIEVLHYAGINTYIPDGGIKTEPLSSKENYIMTIKKWIKLTTCECPLITDYDGFGYYVIKVNGKYFETNTSAIPGATVSNYAKENFTHVVWYNK